MILSGFAIRRLFIALKEMRIGNPYSKVLRIENPKQQRENKTVAHGGDNGMRSGLLKTLWRVLEKYCYLCNVFSVCRQYAPLGL